RMLSANDLEFLKELNVGVGSSLPTELTAVGNTLYFSAAANGSDRELWKSDGTAAGTVLVKDIRPGGTGSSPFQLTDVNGTLYFTAADGTNGRELWKSDGSAAGTVLVKDIHPGGDAFGSTTATVTNFASIG